MKSRTVTLFFLLMLVLGFWLRIDAADWALPFRLHPDEWKYVRGAANVHEGQWNPKYFRNPPGFTYASAAWYLAWMEFGPRPPVPEWFTTRFNIIYPEKDVVRTFLYRPFDLVLASRWLSAIFGTLTILLVFWIANEFRMEPPIPVFAAALCAVSFAGVRESHFAVNDTAMAFWVTLAIGFGIRSLRTGDFWNYAVAGAISGVAIAFKYSAFPGIIVLLLFRLLPLLQIGHLSTKPSRIACDMASAAGLCVLCFLLICPFPILDPQTFFAEMEKLSNAASQGWPGQEKIWSGFLFLEALVISEGTLSLLFALVGIAALCKNKKWAVLIFPLAYAILLCSHPLFFIRFALPFLPWVAITAAVGIYWCSEWFLPEKIRPLAAFGVVVICMLQPLSNGLRSNYLLKQSDLRVEALRWLKEQDDNVLVAADQYAFPLSYWGSVEPWSQPMDPRIVVIDPLPSNRLHELDTISKVPTGMIAISTFAAFPGKIPDTYEERRHALIRYARSSNEVGQFFLVRPADSPAYAGGLHAADVEDTYSPVTELWSRQHPGPDIVIFPVDRNESTPGNSQ